MDRLQIGDKVTYAQVRETQDIDADRRNAFGRVEELDVIDGEDCAAVRWDWGGRFWVRQGLLLKVV